MVELHMRQCDATVALASIELVTTCRDARNILQPCCLAGNTNHDRLAHLDLSAIEDLLHLAVEYRMSFVLLFHYLPTATTAFEISETLCDFQEALQAEYCSERL